MKNLDQFSRRIIIVAISISIVLLSGSLFIVSLNGVTSAQAKGVDVAKEWSTRADLSGSYFQNSPGQDDLEEDIRAIYAFGIGIRDGNLYFGILYNNNTVGLHLAPADGEDVLEW